MNKTECYLKRIGLTMLLTVVGSLRPGAPGFERSVTFSKDVFEIPQKN